MNLKFILALVAIIVSTTLLAQKKTTPEEQNAYKIISFGNSVINLGNSYQESIKNYKSVMNTADNNINKLRRNPNVQLFFVQCNLSTVQASQQQEYTEASKIAPAFNKKSDIQRYVTLGEANVKAMGTWCEAISNYFSEKKYTEDTDFSKYTVLQDSLNYHLEHASINWATAAELSFNAGSEAELVLAKNSPLASFITPMKEDLTALDQVFAKIKTGDADIISLKKDLATLSLSAVKNADVSTKDVSKLRDLYYREVYQNFYRNLSSTTSNLNKLVDLMGDSKATEHDLRQWYTYASSDYNKVVENYNTFVGQ